MVLNLSHGTDMAVAENSMKNDEHLLLSATLQWRFPPCWQGSQTIGQVHKELFQSNSRSSYGCVTKEVIDRLVYKLQLLLERSRGTDRQRAKV